LAACVIAAAMALAAPKEAEARRRVFYPYYPPRVVYRAPVVVYRSPVVVYRPPVVVYRPRYPRRVRYYGPAYYGPAYYGPGAYPAPAYYYEY